MCNDIVCITLERYGGFYHAAQIKAVLPRLFLGTAHNIYKLSNNHKNTSVGLKDL